MKTFIFLSILLSVIAFPAFGALTDADLDKIRLIVNDSEKRIREEMKAEITNAEARIKDYVDIRFKSIDERFQGVDKQIQGVDKQITHVTYITYGLIALIIAAIGIPQIIVTWRSGRDRSLERQVEILTEEIETLKRKQIIQP